MSEESKNWPIGEDNDILAQSSQERLEIVQDQGLAPRELEILASRPDKTRVTPM